MVNNARDSNVKVHSTVGDNLATCCLIVDVDTSYHVDPREERECGRK